MTATQEDRAGRFEAEAERKERSFLAEYWLFLRSNRKWWLLPVIVALLLVGVLVVIGGTVAAPFIYNLF